MATAAFPPRSHGNGVRVRRATAVARCGEMAKLREARERGEEDLQMHTHMHAHAVCVCVGIFIRWGQSGILQFADNE